MLLLSWGTTFIIGNTLGCLWCIYWGPRRIHCIASVCWIWTHLQWGSCLFCNILSVFLFRSNSWGYQFKTNCFILLKYTDIFFPLIYVIGNWPGFSVYMCPDFYVAEKMRWVASVVAFFGILSVMVSHLLSTFASFVCRIVFFTFVSSWFNLGDPFFSLGSWVKTFVTPILWGLVRIGNTLSWLIILMLMIKVWMPLNGFTCSIILGWMFCLCFLFVLWV